MANTRRGPTPFTLVLLLTGCAVPPEPHAAALTTEPATPASHRCDPLGLPVAQPGIVSTSELIELLGRSVHDPKVREIAARLGTRIEDGREYGLLNLHDHGITVVLDVTQHISAIDLHGRTYGVRSFPGELPQGLRFTNSSRDVEDRLGAPWGCDHEGRCVYVGYGVEVRYGPDACISTLTLRPDAPPGAALVNHSVIRKDERGGAAGLSIQVGITVNVQQASRITVRLEQGNGEPIPATQDRKDVTLEGTIGWAVDYEGSGQIDLSRFVPFHAMALEKGDRAIVPVVRVESRSSDETVPVTALEGHAQERSFEQPRCSWNRFGLSEVTVADADYEDASDLGVSLGRPDLAWQVSFEHRPLFRSSERPDTLTGRWSETTPWFRACEGDRIAIDVHDIDAAFHDEIGGRTLVLSELRDMATSNTPLSAGRVLRAVPGGWTSVDGSAGPPE